MPEEAVRFLELELQVAVCHLTLVTGTSVGPWKQQYAPLTAEPSVQPP